MFLALPPLTPETIHLPRRCIHRSPPYPAPQQRLPAVGVCLPSRQVEGFDLPASQGFLFLRSVCYTPPRSCSAPAPTYCRCLSGLHKTRQTCRIERQIDSRSPEHFAFGILASKYSLQCAS